jgi:hypothetical protein
MKSRPLTVRDYVRAVSRVITPIATGIGKALTVNEYVSGRAHGSTDGHAATSAPGTVRHTPRRPWTEWPLDNTWGYDPDSERVERELWTEQSFFDADIGVTYGESTWDGRWNNDEAWRR